MKILFITLYESSVISSSRPARGRWLLEEGKHVFVRSCYLSGHRQVLRLMWVGVAFRTSCGNLPRASCVPFSLAWCCASVARGVCATFTCQHFKTTYSLLDTFCSHNHPSLCLPFSVTTEDFWHLYSCGLASVFSQSYTWILWPCCYRQQQLVQRYFSQFICFIGIQALYSSSQNHK